jgi:pilus assembly protein Flp/PilA
MVLRTYVRMVNALSADRGATAVEYGLMVALIAAVIVVAVTALGTQINDLLGGPLLP